MKRSFVILIALTAAAAPASAQDPPRHSIRGFGGVTFMSETASVFGAGAGARVHRNIEIVGEVGRLTNILPRQIQRDLDEAARILGPSFGGTLTIDAQAPGVYGLGGIRVSSPTSSRLRVFGEAGAGVARGVADIHVRLGGADVSQAFTDALGLEDSVTKPLMALGGGVGVPLTDTLGLELGYRYMRIFTEDPRINTGTMSAALRWGF